MANGIKISMKPTLDQLRRKLNATKKRVSNTSSLYKKASILCDQWVQHNFKTEGGEVGGWEPLKNGGRWVRGRGLDSSAKILQHTGRLRNSYLPFYSKRNAGIGSDLPYSKPHNEGSYPLPDRRMLPDTRKDKGLMSRIKKLHESHVNKAIKNV